MTMLKFEKKCFCMFQNNKVKFQNNFITVRTWQSEMVFFIVHA